MFQPDGGPSNLIRLSRAYARCRLKEVAARNVELCRCMATVLVRH